MTMRPTAISSSPKICSHCFFSTYTPIYLYDAIAMRFRFSPKIYVNKNYFQIILFYCITFIHEVGITF